MKKIDAVIVFKPDHMHVTRIAVKNLNRFAGIRLIYLISNSAGLAAIGDVADNIKLVHEDSVIPNMTLGALKKMKIEGFPKRAGWYYQQLLKWGAAYFDNITEHYLVWEADTILLRPMTFFDNQERVIFTTDSDYHAPYYHTYKHFFQEDAGYEFSLIAQHMVIDRKILNEMLLVIDDRFAGSENWAWKMMNNLTAESNSKMADYETYGYYVKNHHPDKVVFRQVPWTRWGSSLTSPYPSDGDLRFLSKEFCFAAFETWDSPRVKLKSLIRRFTTDPLKSILKMFQ
jgi:hypothetical protein